MSNYLTRMLSEEFLVVLGGLANFSTRKCSLETERQTNSDQDITNNVCLIQLLSRGCRASIYTLLLNAELLVFVSSSRNRTITT